MDPFVIKGIQLLLSLSILVVLHELGHFIPAKLFKTKVEKFYLFFDVNFALFKKKIGDTEYGIGWLPLGGYVKIAGMIDESMDTEQMKQPPQPWEFRSKPAWQRLIIMLGGVTVNIVLGFLIYMMILFVWGKETLPTEDVPNGLNATALAESIGFQDGDQVLAVDGSPLEYVLDINKHLFLRSPETVTVMHANGVRENLNIPEDFGTQMFEAGDMYPLNPAGPIYVDSLYPGNPAETAGMKVGDVLLSFDGKPITTLDDLRSDDLKEQDSVVFSILRENSEKTITVFPTEKAVLGFIIRPKLDFQTTHVDLGFNQSIEEGFRYGYWTLHDYVAQFKYIFTKKGASQVGGFGAIGNLFPAQWDWQGFWSSTALISIILAFMNVLPVPALDGGHVMFLLYEMLSGRKPNDKFMEYAQMFGFFLLLALVLFANGNDLYRWLFG
ncbi:MAG: RIP metalloprotease RseP [Flavobacteriaceae bacterium]